MEQLRQEKLEIDQQLRSIHGSTMGSMQSLPMTRRNDRGGYNADMDGGGAGPRGGGRGGMRGRGRGGRGGPGGPGGPRHGNDSRYTSNTGSSNVSSDYGSVRPPSINSSAPRGRGGNPPLINGRSRSQGNKQADKK